jgi:hypothetical protein
MRSFNEQISRIRQQKAKVLLSDIAAQELVTETMERYLKGERNDRQVRFDLENIIRDAYRQSARGAQEAARFQVGRGRKWAPVPKDITTDTLRRLLEDVRRNLREFKESEATERDVRRAVLRFRLSAGHAAQAGFSDGQQIAFTDLVNDGVEVRKFWGANFDHGNAPCNDCINLHGVEVAIDAEFPTFGRISTYGPLYAPPLHPQCRCDGIYVVVENGNRDDAVLLGEPEEPKMIDSEFIRNMPVAIFKAIIGALARALDLLRKAAGL